MPKPVCVGWIQFLRPNLQFLQISNLFYDLMIVNLKSSFTAFVCDSLIYPFLEDVQSCHFHTQCKVTIFWQFFFLGVPNSNLPMVPICYVLLQYVHFNIHQSRLLPFLLLRSRAHLLFSVIYFSRQYFIRFSMCRCNQCLRFALILYFEHV